MSELTEMGKFCYLNVIKRVGLVAKTEQKIYPFRIFIQHIHIFTHI